MNKSLKTALLLAFCFFLSPLHASGNFQNLEIENVEGNLKNGVFVQINGHSYSLLNATHVGWRNNDDRDDHSSQRYVKGSIEMPGGESREVLPFLLPRRYDHQLIKTQRNEREIQGEEGWIRVEKKKTWYRTKDRTTYTTPYEWAYDERATTYRGTPSTVVRTSCYGFKKCYPIKNGIKWGKHHKIREYVKASIRIRCEFRFPDGTMLEEDNYLGGGPLFQRWRLTKNCPHCDEND